MCVHPFTKDPQIGPVPTGSLDENPSAHHGGRGAITSQPRAPVMRSNNPHTQAINSTIKKRTPAIHYRHLSIKAMYPKKRPGLVAQNTDNEHSTTRAEKEAIVADENQQVSGRKRSTEKTSFSSFTGSISEEVMEESNQFQHLPSHQYRMNLRSRDSPAGTARVSYAEDLRRSDIDDDDVDEEEYDYKEEETKPTAARHKRRHTAGHASHDPHAYNGHRFGRRGDPRMTRSLQIKLDNPDMDCTLALIKGGYRYDVGASDKSLDEDGITLGQRRNQLARRVRNERRKTGGVQSLRGKKRPAGNRKKTPKRKKPKAAEVANRSASSRPISPSPPASDLPTPPLPPMDLNYEADDPYEFERMEIEGDEKDYPPLPALPSGDVEVPLQQQINRIRKEELQQVDSPYISDISDIEEDVSRPRGVGNTAGIASAGAAAATAAAPAPPFPTYQGAPLIPSLPVTPSMSFAPKPKDDTESVVGENLLEEDMLGLTEEEKQEAHDDVHGYRKLDSSLMQTVMNKFLRISKDSVETTIRENKAIGKSVENLMSPAVQDLIRQMKIEIEARPPLEKDAMLKAFVRISPAQRQVEFGDKRLELFLRREHMDPKAAAARFVKYWVKRKEVFGPEKYFLPLDIDGALKDDRVALEVGHWIILPKPDNHGRTIMLWLKRGPYDFDSMSRALFYIAEQAILLPSSRKGIVWLSADLNTTIWKYDRRLDQFVIDLEEFTLPMEATAVHVCSVQGYLWRLLKPVVLACFSRRTRERLRLHLSSDGDIADILHGYGIERSALPSILGGEIDADEAYNRWLAERGLAQWHIYSCANE